ncbi:MAG: hypothetical protein ABSE73_20625, partial [Planctomycetota bacterium]
MFKNLVRTILNVVVGLLVGLFVGWVLNFFLNQCGFASIWYKIESKPLFETYSMWGGGGPGGADVFSGYYALRDLSVLCGGMCGFIYAQ